MSRGFVVAVVAASVAFAPDVMAQSAINLNSSKSNITQPSGSGSARATTVKGSKSNSSERKGQTTQSGGTAAMKKGKVKFFND
jgi:hypothetical protein